MRGEQTYFALLPIKKNYKYLKILLTWAVTGTTNKVFTSDFHAECQTMSNQTQCTFQKQLEM